MADGVAYGEDAPKPTLCASSPGDLESSHPSSAMSICSDWKLQPLSHQQAMNLTGLGGNSAARNS
jgi:hypothetical protein